jgi:membrane-bound metal-dependent hydrolase YbcI (DUF457 family)
MTPLGHASVGYLAGRLTRLIDLRWMVAASLLPDVDFLLVAFPFFNDLHRRLTHNVFFALLAGLLVWIVTRPNSRRAVLSVVIGCVLHIVCDSFVDTNASNGLGVALLWPVSDVRLGPLFSCPASMNVSWHHPWQALRAVPVLMLLELPFVLLAGVVWLRRRSCRQTSVRRSPATGADYAHTLRQR